LLAAATLARPYSIVCIPFLLFIPALWRALRAKRSEWIVAVGATALPFIAWAGRNWYWYRRFVPLTTMGLGATLHSFRMEAEIGSVYDPVRAATYYKTMTQFESGVTLAGNRQLTDSALAWLSEHPGAALRTLVVHVGKLWISLGTEGKPLGPSVLVLVPYLGGLLVLGVLGFWLKRRDKLFWPLLFTIVPYWGFLLNSSEARRTLPLRLPMLLFGAVAFAWLWDRLPKRRAGRDNQRIPSTTQ